MKTAGNNLLSFCGCDGFKRRFASWRVPPKTWAAQSRRPFFFCGGSVYRPGYHPHVSRSSEIALRAKLELERILVLELVERTGFGAVAVKIELPDIFWSRWVYITSAENVRFLTGVQRVTTPSCATLKSGLQV